MSKLNERFNLGFRKIAVAQTRDVKDQHTALKKVCRRAVVAQTTASIGKKMSVDARKRAELAAEDAASAARLAIRSGGGRPAEIGGPKGLEPTRYGDWEKAGRCIDF